MITWNTYDPSGVKIFIDDVLMSGFDSELKAILTKDELGKTLVCYFQMSSQTIKEVK